MVKVFKTRRNLSKKEILNVIYGVYNSFTNFKNKQKPYSEVGFELGIKPVTIRSLIRRFKLKHSLNIDSLVSKNHKQRQIIPIGSPEIEKELIS